MTENKVLEFEFSARSETAGKLTKLQLEHLDHEIQASSLQRKSQEILGNLAVRKRQAKSVPQNQAITMQRRIQR